MPTIGISVAVPDPWGQQLQDYRVELGDPSARLIPTHITLVPPYEVEDGDIEKVVAFLESVCAGVEPFTVHLRGTGTFRPVSPVVFVNVVEGISSCEQIARQLRGGPLDAELRFPYHPHVTVAHEVEDVLLDCAFTELAGFEARFDVDTVHLYEHDESTGWHPTHAVPLGRA